MNAQDFMVSHLATTEFKSDGLRAFLEYRDLGIKAATKGQVVAHIIRARPGAHFEGKPHLHATQFQMIYVIRGWIKFRYEGQPDIITLTAGSCAYQPPSLNHQEIGHSDDLEMLEIVMPAEFETKLVPEVG